MGKPTEFRKQDSGKLVLVFYFTLLAFTFYPFEIHLVLNLQRL